jgi:hypothetical protein
MDIVEPNIRHSKFGSNNPPRNQDVHLPRAYNGKPLPANNPCMLSQVLHNIIEQCAFVHVSPDNMTMGCRI